MNLVFMVTARCNASCGHCSTSCGPHRTEALSRETLLRLIDEAADAAAGEPLEISLTGGEPFLDFALLRAVVAHGTQRGAQMTCVTNGYWATSDARAEKLLGELKAAGLLLMAISTSSFHQQFVKAARVQRALAAARRVGLETVLKFVQLRSQEAETAAVVAWARAAGAERVEVIPILPSVRDGEHVADAEFARRDGLPEGRCPGALLNIGETGEAYPCCTPGAFRPFFSLGNVAQATIGDLREAFQLDAKMQILREHGPAWLARDLQARGHGARLRRAYGGVCDLCTHIGSDEVLAAAAQASVQARAQEQFDGILGRLVETAPA